MADNRKIRDLLQKCEHYDADERFMATNDLIKELDKVQGFLDQTLQVPVRNAVLKQLEDKGKDVSTIAVKCLSSLVKKFNPDQVNAIVDKMGMMIVEEGSSDEGSSRDVFVDGIRNVIASVDDNNGKAFAPKLLDTLLRGLTSRSEDISVKMMSMDIVKDLLERFGNSVTTLHAALLNALTSLLQHSHDAVQKRASVTLGPLVGYLDDKSFNSLMVDVIIKNIEGTQPDVYIQSVGVISKAAGVRVGEYLPRIIPALQRYCQQKVDDPETTVQLWQDCLQAFEFIITRCPNKITPYADDLMATGLKMMKHDPNVVQTDDMDVDGEEAEDWGEDGGEEWGDVGDEANGDNGWDMGDEEAVIPQNASDESWKVRLAAVGVISAFIHHRSDLVQNSYGSICEALISRFQERDASVLQEVLLACRDLLRDTVVVSTGTKNAHDHDDDDDDEDMLVLGRTRSAYQSMDLKISSIVHGLGPILAGTTIQAQKAAFSVLCELVIVRRGHMDGYFDTIMTPLLRGLQASGKAGVLNIGSLRLLHLLLEFHSHEQLKAYLPDLTKATVSSVKVCDETTKPQALNVIASIAKRLPTTRSKTVVKELYRVTLSQLILKDTSAAIKTASVRTMAIILAHFGNQLPESETDVLPVYHERLGNDVSREPALKAITKVANSEAKCHMDYIVKTSIGDLCSFLRKASPKLKHRTVRCLGALVRTESASFQDGDFSSILSEVSQNISDSDLHLSHVVLDLVSTMLVASSSVTQQVANTILPLTLEFVKSPLLQGESLKSTINFFCACVTHGQTVSQLQHSSLLHCLLGVINGTVSKPSLRAVSKCIAGITLLDPEQAKATALHFVSNVKGTGEEQVREVSLLSIGEIGRRVDLSSQKGIEGVLFSAVQSSSDGVRQAASFALGNVAVGSMEKFLPMLLQLISSEPSHQYSLLSALKETIATHTTKEYMQALLPYLDSVAPLLLDRAQSQDEGTRSMVAQCLGRLAVIEPQKIIPKLAALAASESVKSRQVVATAIRFSFSPLADWDFLGEHLEPFLRLLQDRDLEVRLQAVRTVIALFHTNFSVIKRSLLDGIILPGLYAETKVHLELVQEVDYGNFKEKVDDGLPLRKTTFQALAVLLETGSKRINMQEFVSHVIGGLTDVADIQIPAFKLMEEIAVKQPTSLLEILDTLPGVLMPNVKQNLKLAKTKTVSCAPESVRFRLS